MAPIATVKGFIIQASGSGTGGWDRFYKTLFLSNFLMAKKVVVFVPVKPFQHSVMFGGMPTPTHGSTLPH